MDNVLSKLKEMGIWQKVTIAVVILAIIIFSIVLSSKPKKAEQAILYQNLDANEAKTIEKEIAKIGYDTVLNEDSTEITVDADKVSKIKAHLATLGLPSTGDPGFELLDESSITDTNYDKQKKYERALVGDIQKGLIQGFNFIEKAVVQLNYQENESIFTEEESESKASATIHTINNKELTEEQVAAIKNFIASSVKNLSAENVSVMDKNGIVYDENSGSGAASGAYQKQLEILSATEKRIENDIQKMLVTNFGKENVSTIVRAEVDFDEIVQNIEKYDPNGTLVSRQQDTEKIVKRDTGGSQVVGTETNGSVPDYELDNNDDANIALQQDKDSIIENFEVGKTVETIKKNPELTNIQVTVTINEDLDIVNNEEFIQEWQEIIANAAGIRQNDQGGFDNGNVKVSVQPFAKINTNELVDEEALQAEASEQAIKKEKEKTFYVFLVIGMIMLILAIVAWFVHKRREEIVVTQEGEGDFTEFEEEIVDEDKEKSDILMSQIDRNKKNRKWDYDEFTEQQKDLATEYRKVVEENPEIAKDYIKKLINEG